MATVVNQVNITASDNELYVIASQGRESSELCHIKSGFNEGVNFSFNPRAVLPPGDYDLTFVGMNWGGPWRFDVATTPSVGLPPTINGSGTVGVVWNKTVQIKVP